MGRIRIISTPPGQAPEWVRKEWIGMELPIIDKAPSGRQTGVMGGKAENVGGYSVHGSVAMELLEKKSSKAADWWHSNIPGIVYATLVFKKEICEVIE